MSNRQPRRPASSTTYPTTYPAHPVTAASSPARPAAARSGTTAPAHLSTKGCPAPHTATYPAGRPAPSYTSRTLPEGWRVDPRPSRYLDPADPADAPHLAEADATPTGMFPTRRSIRPRPLHESPSQHGGAARPQHEGGLAADAASLSHGGAGARAVYHTDRQAPRPAPSQPEQGTPIQDMGRPGILRRPSMRWHPSLMQLAIGAALVVALLTSSQLLALDGIYSARQAALRESRHAASASAPQQAPSTPTPKPAWTVHGTDSPYDRTDPLASPLDLPRCTTSPDTPMPCLAHISNDFHHVTVLEEDASLTGLDRR